MRRLLLLMLGVLFVGMQLLAQNRTVTGKVTDEKGNPVPGASVIVRGTKSGTVADADGNFSLSVPANAKTLTISSLSFDAKEVTIGNGAVNVVMTSRNSTLNEVVVTSLGITRDKRSLGYATQTVKADQLADRGEVNVVSALQGKVAGVQITGASGSPGASVNINIRGISSFQGSNQPLFVVDGIPISNDVDRTNGGPLGSLGDAQPPNRALDLDVNNIESINVLKGPAAAVLYGSRASAGAIIITTKKGGNAGGRAQVILSSSYSNQNVIGIPEVQNEYGQGTLGQYLATTGNSWGPKFGATPTLANGLIDATGKVVPYVAYPNNIREFFESGVIKDNNLTINGGDQKQNFTFVMSNLDQRGILPNTSLNRTNVKFGANTVLRDKIRLGGSVTFINTLQKGILGGNGNSALGVLAGFPRSVDLTGYKTNGTYKNPDGTNNFFLSGTDNPYFDAFENPLTSKLYRIIGNISLGYDFTSWLSIQYRLGIDAYTDRRHQIFAISSARVPAGQVLDNTLYRSELNGDLILNAKTDKFLVKGLSLSGLIGQNVNQRSFQSVVSEADALGIAGFYNASNGTNFNVGTGEVSVLRRLLGYYAQASFNYNNYLFLEFTGRVDQSSTLPKDKNTYFYPSVNAGFVFTDALKINNSFLNYGKIRGSATKVGRDADPYLLSNTYAKWGFGNNVASFNFPFGSVPGFGASSRIAPSTLSPEFTTSYEAGLNLGFLKNRITVDLAYFNEDSKAQIIDVGIAPSTGYGSKTTNIGELTNKGIEAVVTVNILQGKNLTWDVSGNFTKIKNRVVSIAPGIDNFSIPGSAFIGSIPSVKVGYPYGVIIGGVLPKSPNGLPLINPATGTFQPTIAGQVLSDPNPDYKIGFTSNLRYKGFFFSTTMDFSKGGQILSFTSAIYKSRGAWKNTAIDRDQPHLLPGEIQIAPDKYIPNNIQVSAQTYWQALGGLQSEFNVYDATVFRMREISIGYDIPPSVISRLKINGIRFSIFANNVFYVAPNAFIDPEVNTQGAGNIRGLELQSAPNARTIGANLRLSF